MQNETRKLCEFTVGSQIHLFIFTTAFQLGKVVLGSTLKRYPNIPWFSATCNNSDGSTTTRDQASYHATWPMVDVSAAFPWAQPTGLAYLSWGITATWSNHIVTETSVFVKWLDINGFANLTAAHFIAKFHATNLTAAHFVAKFHAANSTAAHFVAKFHGTNFTAAHFVAKLHVTNSSQNSHLCCLYLR